MTGAQSLLRGCKAEIFSTRHSGALVFMMETGDDSRIPGYIEGEWVLAGFVCQLDPG